MKRTYIFIILLLVGLFSGCSKLPKENNKLYRQEVREDLREVFLMELEAGCSFFWDLANNDLSSPGYGLIPDRYNTFTKKAGLVASIASVGFGLSTIPISIELNKISRSDGEERAYYTLLTLKKLQRVNGFWHHFIDMKTGQRAYNSEISIIDSAILINGAIIVGEYFGGRVKALADELYLGIQWDWFYNGNMNKFYMGYSPENGFEGYWSGYAEHLMMFVLGAGSPKYPVPAAAYTMMKLEGKLSSKTSVYEPFYLTYTGSLFTYQFSHAWIDFSKYKDQDGYDWYLNSVNAVKAAIDYASNNNEYITLNENSWGLSACDGPSGYVGPYGSPPSAGGAHVVDGTIPAYGALGSIVFLPRQAIKAVEHYYTYERFWSEYGFKDAYNLDNNGQWFARDIIGIDKGISVLMIENYLSGMIWEIYHENKYVEAGLKKLGFYKE